MSKISRIFRFTNWYRDGLEDWFWWFAHRGIPVAMVQYNKELLSVWRGGRESATDKSEYVENWNESKFTIVKEANGFRDLLK